MKQVFGKYENTDHGCKKLKNLKPVMIFYPNNASFKFCHSCWNKQFLQSPKNSHFAIGKHKN